MAGFMAGEWMIRLGIGGCIRRDGGVGSHGAADHCGRAVFDTTKSLAVMIVESHSGRLGSAHLHHDCTEPSLSRYRQVIEWDGTIANLTRVKQLHRRLATANRSSYGSVPLLLT